MKKYRIKNRNPNGYIVQERQLLFFWYTCISTRFSNSIFLGYHKKTFLTIEEAREYVKDLKMIEKKYNTPKYTEYL